jgi:hypothetical protein
MITDLLITVVEVGAIYLIIVIAWYHIRNITR